MTTDPSPIRTCFNCTTVLNSIFDDNSYGQFKDALTIKLAGGYGMFFDEMGKNVRKIIICKDCAIRLFELFPNLATIIHSNFITPIQPMDT